jgi:hypothetical protein
MSPLVSAAEVDESVMIKTQMGMRYRSKWSQCKGRIVRPPRDSNNKI